MNTPNITISIALEPYDPARLANLCGQFNEHLQHIENRLRVQISSRGNIFQLSGFDKSVQMATQILKKLYADTQSSTHLQPDDIHLAIQEHIQVHTQERQEQSMAKSQQQDTRETKKDGNKKDGKKALKNVVSLQPDKAEKVKPRGLNQTQYTENIQQFDINFGIGPAGTGKTYLAVACAVQALESNQVERIILVRPAVEAGEKLGFLPGDATEKIDPYLRPLYDALFDLLGQEKVNRFLQRGIIEIAPLAFMRGRTLNNAFIILDEGQNTTCAQMKMFLTRLGFKAKVVITGDITQIDLPKGTPSGLVQAQQVLNAVPGIAFTQFCSADIVRHELVQRIVNAYNHYDEEKTLLPRSNHFYAQKDRSKQQPKNPAPETH